MIIKERLKQKYNWWFIRFKKLKGLIISYR